MVGHLLEEYRALIENGLREDGQRNSRRVLQTKKNRPQTVLMLLRWGEREEAIMGRANFRKQVEQFKCFQETKEVPIKKEKRSYMEQQKEYSVSQRTKVNVL